MKKGIAGILAAVLLAASAGTMTACIQPREDSGSYDKALKALDDGDYDLAMSEFENAAENDGREAEGYRGQGIVYFDQESYDAAIIMFDKSLEALKYENEDFTNDVLMYEADAYMKKGNSDEAVRIYESLEDGSMAYMAYALEGQICLRNGDIDKAKECFAASEELKQSIDIYLMIYETFAEVSREGDGAAYLEKAKQIEPSTPEEMAELGKICYYLEDFNNAAVWLNKAIEAGYTDGVNILGTIYLEQDDVSSAKAVYISALNQNMDPAMDYNGLVMCAIKEENYESALTYVEMGLECADDDAKKSLLFNEIIAYEKLLDFDTAGKKLEEFMKLYPGDTEAKEEAKFLLR